jgi:hypothetical protein
LIQIEYGVQDCCNVVILNREVETDQYVIMETKYDMQIKREKQKTRLILLCWLSFDKSLLI